MSAGETPLSRLVRRHANVALRQLVAAGDVAQAMLHLQGAVRDMHGGEVRLRTGSALIRLAHRVAQRRIEASDGAAVRAVFRAGLNAAVDGRDADLRARLLMEIAQQYHELGYPAECLELLGLAEADQRVSEGLRRELAEGKVRTVECDGRFTVEAGP